MVISSIIAKRKEQNAKKEQEEKNKTYAIKKQNSVDKAAKLAEAELVET